MTFSVAPTSAADLLTTAHNILDVEPSQSTYRSDEANPEIARLRHHYSLARRARGRSQLCRYDCRN